MALDGVMLRHLVSELKDKLLGSRINKIYQPSAREISLILRGKTGKHKLLMSANAEAPRVSLTERTIENPQVPKAFCMLLRSKISSAKIVNIQQNLLERVVCFYLSAKDEIGSDVCYKLLLEIMGKHSNIIFLDESDKVLDSIVRVDSNISSKRVVLPGVTYSFPPSQNKMCILDTPKNDIIKKIFSLSLDSEKTFRSAIMETIQGISEIVVDFLLFNSGCKKNEKLCKVSASSKEKFSKSLEVLFEITKNRSGSAYRITKEDSKEDISFLKITGFKCLKFESFSKLIDEHYTERTEIYRVKSLAGNLLKNIENIILLKKNKIKNQEKELKKCLEKEKFKLFGDLLISNPQNTKIRMKSLDVLNFFSGANETINIPLDDKISVLDNAQIYYKKYKKYKKAEEMLKIQISESKSDILYLENTLDSLKRSRSESEINEIYDQVVKEGYIKSKPKQKFKLKPVSFIEFISPNGYKILIGRNSKQNEKLTYKTASKNDLWFHVKDMPGSHTVMFTKGQNVSQEDIMFAAKLSAQHSTAKNSSGVEVDYTEVSNVKKPKIYKPGMAIYKNYKTLYVKLV